MRLKDQTKRMAEVGKRCLGLGILVVRSSLTSSLFAGKVNVSEKDLVRKRFC